MKFFKKIGLLFLLAVSFVSCNDEDPDTVGPTIEITNIPDNKEYKFGETITMALKFTDQTGVFEYQYKLYAKDNVTEGFNVNSSIVLDGYFTDLSEAKSIHLPTKLPNEVYHEGDYIIEIKAADIYKNISTYIKPIKITYPVE